MSDRISKAIINLDNYRHNLEEIRSKLSDNVKIMAVVKANAYGHGLVELAKAAIDVGAEYLGIVSIGELKRLREAGIESPCLILNYLDIDSIKEAIEINASVTAMDPVFIQALQDQAQAANKTVSVHLKIDSGLHRAGCSPAESVLLARQIVDSPNLDLSGIFTHLAESEDVDTTYTTMQLKVFNECIKEIQSQGINTGLLHCSNSAAILAHPKAHFDMVRPGILTYGINPFPKEHTEYTYVQSHFLPVLEIRSKVVYIRKLEVGESVGYNRRWCAEKPSTVALIPIGYGDGYRRTPFNAGYMLVAGSRCPIIGTVSMDQTIIDITDVLNVEVNDEVVILGSQNNSSITIDDIASAYQTINYEVATSLTDRIERLYI